MGQVGKLENIGLMHTNMSANISQVMKTQMFSTVHAELVKNMMSLLSRFSTSSRIRMKDERPSSARVCTQMEANLCFIEAFITPAIEKA